MAAVPVVIAKKRRRRQESTKEAKGPRFNIVSALLFLALFAAGFLSSAATRSPHGIVLGLVLGLIFTAAPKIAGAVVMPGDGKLLREHARQNDSVAQFAGVGRTAYRRALKLR